MADQAAKKVAIVIPTLGGGGAERVVLASATDLASRGHRVDLLLLQGKGELLALLPKAVRVINLNASRILGALRPLVRYLRAERPDALHVVMWPVTIIAILAHRLARSDATLMVSDHVAYSQPFLTARQTRLLRLTTRIFYSLADHRIVVSEAAADDLARLSGIARQRFEVIYNPISPPQHIASNAQVEALWGGAGPRIINVGALKEQKNHALLLDAFARLGDKSARLMILGQGHLRGALERQARELGIADRVIMPGFCADPWPYLASADLFVLSSDYEGFGLVIAEAMYAGLKVVSTNCQSGPAEILGDGKYGRLVRCGDAPALAEAIDAALAEPADPERMRARAMEISGPSTLDRYADLLL